MSRRRTGPSLVTIYWRDIPAQVIATADGTTERLLLTNRFQIAIDRAARVAGKTERDAYVAEWRRETHSLDGDPAAAARARVEQLETHHTRARLAALVSQGGLGSPGEAS